MAIGWNMSAAIATLALVVIGVAIYKKAKDKEDSPLYALLGKFSRFKKKGSENMQEESIHYKRLSHKGGIKW